MKQSIVWDKKVKSRLKIWVIALVVALMSLIFVGFNVLDIDVIETMKKPGFVIAIVLGIVAIIFFILWIVRWRNGDKRYKATLNAALQKIKGCMSELTEYRRVYYSNVNKKGELFSLIEHL